ncbi:hypothetical protein K3172_03305 [Qipengyuania sp. 6B39]|uniref:hypothetical protein n=1 Tax=Qipengyuania proteolytica TaxID=2867239 RepID=UPI001C8B03CA|nr:hypothetical protein [Qipengyuania proteolytica]MBX7494883.1 hypothetical protein [Qipengyuania proteolytica]
MVLEVKVNVFVRDVKEKGNTGEYEGKFHFQQVLPLKPTIVHKNGTVNLKKAGVTEEVAITYVWCSPAVELDGELVPTRLAEPAGNSFWVLPNDAKPGPSHGAKSSGEVITVTGGATIDDLVMHDTNAIGKHFTYCYAVKLGIVGEPWLVCDPKIINTGSTRTLYSYRPDSGDAAA